jgi:prepilin-type N-terminal cleavage/methylation domain-containing protein
VRYRTPSNRGFSLLELLIVIAIIAVVVAIAIPQALNWLRGLRAMTAAQAVQSQVQQGRAQAVKRNTRFGILLSINYPAQNSFQWTTLDYDPSQGGPPATSNYYPGPGANPIFDPNNPNYGVTPALPFNTQPDPALGASPHGPVQSLPQDYVFVPPLGGAQFNALLFQSNGRVFAVTAAGAGVGGNMVGINGLNIEIRVADQSFGFARTVQVSQNGRVTILPN